jgi:hypothetical protein
MGRLSLGPQWRKSQRSQANGSCLEARFAEGVVEIRDTKDRSGPTLSFVPEAWTDFIAALSSGQFD